MLDEKDLQAIAQLIDAKLDQKLAQQKVEIMHEVGALIEVDVIPRFNLLADGQTGGRNSFRRKGFPPRPGTRRRSGWMFWRPL